ncbi:MAG: YcxB family protein [Bernardetiaceae bacterium]|nr:YcxB family protein [Bernardetiaceae bacterium]
MEKNVTVRVEMTLLKYLKLNFALLIRSRLVILGLVLAVGFSISLIERALEPTGFEDVANWQLILMATYLTLIFLVLPLHTLIRTYYYFHSDSTLSKPVTYHFDTSEISILTSYSKSSYQWERIYRFRVLHNWILIYKNKYLTFLLPKADFQHPRDIEILIDYAKAKKLLK